MIKQHLIVALLDHRNPHELMTPKAAWGTKHAHTFIHLLAQLGSTKLIIYIDTLTLQ